MTRSYSFTFGRLAAVMSLAMISLVAPNLQAQVISESPDPVLIRLEAATSDAPTRTRGLSIDLGDFSRPVAEASFEVTAWNDECRLHVCLDNATCPLVGAERVEARRNSQPMTRLVMPEYSHELFLREDGNFEWAISLSRKPRTSIFSYRINVTGLTFHYQAKLSEEEIASGCSRPDSVAGSYAVYHSEARDNSQLGQYGTGKAFHIYRPKAWDASGDTVWVDLNIDQTAGTLTLVADSDWLENASYPVLIDPTLGYSSVGASTIAASYNEWNLFSRREAATNDGTVDTVAVYMAENCSLGPEGCLLLFSNDDGSWRPDTAMAAETISSFDGTGWYKQALSSVSFEAGDTLWPGCNVNCTQSLRWFLYYDSGTGNDVVKRDNGQAVCGSAGDSFTQSSFTDYSIISAYLAVTYHSAYPGARRSRLLNE